MANNSAIEWTESTWNPTTGCTKVSSGCKNCYAEKMTKRLKLMRVKKYKKGWKFVQHENELDLPLTWKKPKKIFVNSMSDLFHEQSTMEFIGKCFFTMIKADWHNYQILTKRPDKMAKFSNLFSRYFGFTIPNFIWMGVSVENNDVTWRIKELKKVKCSIRFISFEPLLEKINKVDLKGIDWAIIGGESGHNYRPVEKEWIQSLIKQCQKQNVKVFFKQWGGFRPKDGGRKINGRTYSGYPKKKAVKLSDIKKMKKVQRIERIRNVEKNEPLKISNKQKQIVPVPHSFNRTKINKPYR